MRWTEDEYQAYLTRHAVRPPPVTPTPTPTPLSSFAPTPTPTSSFASLPSSTLPSTFPVTPTPTPSHRSKTETRYAQYLSTRREITAVYYEAVRLTLAPRTTLLLDFLVVYPDHVELHEVKSGYIREDAAVKLKLAASLYPFFRFICAQYLKGAWRFQVVGTGRWHAALSSLPSPSTLLTEEGP